VLLDTGLPRPGGTPDVKGAGDYVTDSDRRSEAAIVEVLHRETPGIAVLAEESGGSRATTMWAVDPLDGTTNFTRSLPAVAVSVGLLDSGRPLVGVVIAPYLQLEFAAAAGGGATLNGETLPRLGWADPARAVVATGFPFRNKQRMPRYRPVMEGAFKRFEDLRRVGAAALDLAWTAAGTFDGYFELGLKPWDLAGGAALVIEVGGRVTDWAGGDGWIESGDIMAASESVHEALLQLAVDGGSGAGS
jgi:myo-inositol-1(or 4)-monophosphatase